MKFFIALGLVCVLSVNVLADDRQAKINAAAAEITLTQRHIAEVQKALDEAKVDRNNELYIELGHHTIDFLMSMGFVRFLSSAVNTPENKIAKAFKRADASLTSLKGKNSGIWFFGQLVLASPFVIGISKAANDFVYGAVAIARFYIPTDKMSVLKADLEKTQKQLSEAQANLSVAIQGK